MIWLFQKYLNRITSFNTFKDQVIFEKNEVVKPDGSPYVVFTPYSKKWKENLSKQKTTFYNSENYLTNLTQHKLELQHILGHQAII